MRSPSQLARLAKSPKPPRARNVERKGSTFARCYHSRERVAWIKASVCEYCADQRPNPWDWVGGSENAHTEIDGMGRKAGYETIVPLCGEHHRAYDRHLAPFDNEGQRQAMKSAAQRIQRAWLACTGDSE